MILLFPDQESFCSIYGERYLSVGSQDQGFGQTCACACDCVCSCGGGDRCSCTSIESHSHNTIAFASLWRDGT